MRWHQRETWISIGMGFGTLFLFLGYFANCFISESVIYSISLEYSGIDKHGGYMGMAAQMISFGLMNAFAPAIVAVFSAKRSIQLTGVTFALYFLGFVSFHEWYYYVSQIVCGFGYAVFNVAEGIYISEHSTPETIEVVTSVETTISHGGQLFSGCLLAFMYRYGSISTGDILKSGFSMDHITAMYISFAITVVIGILIFQILPSEPDTDSYASLSCEQEEEEESIWEQIRSVPSILFNTRMMLLVPLSIYQGFFTIFFLAVYPTAFNFDLNLQQNHDLMWIYCCFIGIGVIFGGFLLAAASSCSHRFTLTWSMSCHAFLVVPTLVIVLYITPEWAFVQPVDSGALHRNSVIFVMIIAFFVGICDCLITTLRSVVCQTVVPGHRMGAFSVTRMTQAFSSAVALLLSPKISVLYWCVILTILLLTACIFLFVVISLARKEECKGASLLPSLSGAIVQIDRVIRSGHGSPVARSSMSPQKSKRTPHKKTPQKTPIKIVTNPQFSPVKAKSMSPDPPAPVYTPSKPPVKYSPRRPPGTSK